MNLNHNNESNILNTINNHSLCILYKNIENQKIKYEEDIKSNDKKLASLKKWKISEDILEPTSPIKRWNSFSFKKMKENSLEDDRLN